VTSETICQPEPQRLGTILSWGPELSWGPSVHGVGTVHGVGPSQGLFNQLTWRLRRRRADGPGDCVKERTAAFGLGALGAPSRKPNVAFCLSGRRVS